MSGSSSTTAQAGVVLPLGVQGDETELSLYISRVPRELYGQGGLPSAGLSDIRRVTYALTPQGLVRQEMKTATSADPGDEMPGTGSSSAVQIMAAEARSLSFEYFDGSGWQSSWDATAPGPDGMTPMGSPRAIAISLTLARPGTPPGANGPVQKYRHVVAIPTANGTTQQTEGGTTP